MTAQTREEIEAEYKCALDAVETAQVYFFAELRRAQTARAERDRKLAELEAEKP